MRKPCSMMSRPLLQLVFSNDERRADPQHVKPDKRVQVLRFQIRRKQPNLRTRAVERRKRLFRGFVANQLDDAEQPFIANVTDAGMILLHAFQTPGQVNALLF